MVTPGNNVYNKTMPMPATGTITRPGNQKVESYQRHDDLGLEAGTVVCSQNGKVYSAKNATGNVLKDAIKGIALRQFHTQINQDEVGKNQLVDVLVSGYVVVTLAKGTIEKGQVVGVCQEDEAVAGAKKGDIVHYQASNNKLIQLDHAYAMNAANEGELVEISYNI